MLEHFQKHPEEPHGRIAVAFTPDEEIGGGTAYFDLKKFGADFAYTFDGDEVNVIADETFNAAEATVSFTGFCLHPGSSKNRMHRLKKILTSRLILFVILVIFQVWLLFMLLWKAAVTYQFYQYLVYFSYILVIYIANKKEDSSYKIAWSVLILILPLLGGMRTTTTRCS